MAANMYKKMGGESWVWNINLTSALFAGMHYYVKSLYFVFVNFGTFKHIYFYIYFYHGPHSKAMLSDATTTPI